MTEFFSNTAVRIALGAVGTTAVAVGSYLIGKHHGVQVTMAQFSQLVEYLEKIESANETPTN